MGGFGDEIPLLINESIQWIVFQNNAPKIRLDAEEAYSTLLWDVGQGGRDGRIRILGRA